MPLVMSEPLKEGDGEITPNGKIRFGQKHNTEPGPVKVYTKEEIQNMQDSKN